MISDQEALITKGRRSLAASRRLYEGGDYDFAASRAYYAMFYLVQALLLSRDLTFSKHSAVIAAFGQHFVKTGLFTAEHYSALRTAFDERNLSDYQYTAPFPRQAAGDLLDRAESFVQGRGGVSQDRRRDGFMNYVFKPHEEDFANWAQRWPAEIRSANIVLEGHSPAVVPPSPFPAGGAIHLDEAEFYLGASLRGI